MDSVRPTRCCRECGTELPRRDGKAGRPRLLCVACVERGAYQSRWLQRRPDYREAYNASRRAPTRYSQCPVCGTEYVVGQGGKSYCSSTCKYKARNAKQRGKPYVRPVRTCSVDGCTRLAVGRSICDTHRQRAKFGIPDVDCVMPGCLRAASHPEGVCLRHLPEPDREVIRYCDRCRLFRVSETASHKCPAVHRTPGGYYYTPRDPHPIACVQCGVEFVGKWTNLCGDCARRNRRDQKSHSKHRRRARLRDAFVEVVYRRKVYERDGWICGICGKQTKRDAVVPHPLAPTLDHIVPLAAGGDHSYANTQCAHYRCNSIKSDGPGQLRLAI